jgi:hypothetical protein
MKYSVKFFAIIFFALGLVLSSCDKDDDDDNSLLVTFDSLKLASNSFWNGADKSGEFRAGGITFPNFNGDGYWNGFAYSNKYDVKTSGLNNQYSCYVPADTNISNTFVVAYPYLGTNTITFGGTVTNVKFKVANSTYAALSMKNGDLYSKKFGGVTGNDNDWFKLTITSYNSNNDSTGYATVNLADFTSADSKNDYILDQWFKIDLSALGQIKKLRFALSSTDNSEWGMNTPNYFCLDDIEFEPVTK